MELVEQRIKLPTRNEWGKLVSGQGMEGEWEGWYAHRVDDVLPLGSIPDVHGIMSNWHHMYDASRGRDGILCLYQQTNVQRDELDEQPLPGAEYCVASSRGASASPHCNSLFAANLASDTAIQLNIFYLLYVCRYKSQNRHT